MDHYTSWAVKACHFYFYDNFGKRRPILITFPPLYFQMTAQEGGIKLAPCLKRVAHYLAKCDSSSAQLYCKLSVKVL